jgi:hypothetical protein
MKKIIFFSSKKICFGHRIYKLCKDTNRINLLHLSAPISIYLIMQKQIKKIFLWIDLLLRKIAQGIISLYQWILSPDKSPFLRHWLGGRVCKHYPHCSQY